MISSSDYQNIVCLLDKGHSSLQYSVADLSAADQILTSATATATRKDPLDNAINNLGTKMNIELSRHSDGSFLQALQSHVQKHYGSLAGFITDNDLQIPQYVADLSLAYGFTIPSDNIVANCFTS